MSASIAPNSKAYPIASLSIISPWLPRKALAQGHRSALGLMLLILFNSFYNSHCIVVRVAFETVHAFLTRAILSIGVFVDQNIVKRLIEMLGRLI